MKLSSRMMLAILPAAALALFAAGVSAQVATTTAVTVTAAATAATSSCPLVTTFMKLGAPNDAADVARLQAFLRSQYGYDVDATGIFDQKTEDAVKAFQRANMAEIMGPWGATQPSGVVYLTTQKKINQIACATPLSLDQTEMSVIGAYRAAADARDGSMLVPAVAAEQPVAVPATAGAADAAVPYDLETVDERSIWTRFTVFLKGLF